MLLIFVITLSSLSYIINFSILYFDVVDVNSVINKISTKMKLEHYDTIMNISIKINCKFLYSTVIQYCACVICFVWFH